MLEYKATNRLDRANLFCFKRVMASIISFDNMTFLMISSSSSGQVASPLESSCKIWIIEGRLETECRIDDYNSSARRFGTPNRKSRTLAIALENRRLNRTRDARGQGFTIVIRSLVKVSRESIGLSLNNHMSK
jgi:hypothetical protein